MDMDMCVGTMRASPMWTEDEELRATLALSLQPLKSGVPPAQTEDEELHAALALSLQPVESEVPPARSPPSLLVLPDDLLLEVLLHAAVTSRGISSVARLCRRIRTITAGQWRVAAVRVPSSAERLAVVEPNLRHCRNLTLFATDPSLTPSPCLAATLVRALGHLEELTVTAEWLAHTPQADMTAAHAILSHAVVEAAPPLRKLSAQLSPTSSLMSNPNHTMHQLTLSQLMSNPHVGLGSTVAPLGLLQTTVNRHGPTLIELQAGTLSSIHELSLLLDGCPTSSAST